MVLEKTLENPLDFKEIKPVQPKGDQFWIFIGRTDADWSWSSNTLTTWCEDPTHWKRPWFWERLKAGGEGDKRGWDGWLESQTTDTAPSCLTLCSPVDCSTSGFMSTPCPFRVYWVNGHKFEQISGDSEGQGSLSCGSPRGLKWMDRIANEQLGVLLWGREVVSSGSGEPLQQATFDI